jgi:hypothetical protein
VRNGGAAYSYPGPKWKFLNPKDLRAEGSAEAQHLVTQIELEHTQ